MPHATILSIDEIVNHQLRLRCDVSLHVIKSKYELSNENIEYVRQLFHGTGRTHPSEIYSSDIGFMNQFAAAGRFGRGTYFAKRAAYSDSYAFTVSSDQSGTVKQMFLAKVITAKHAELHSPDPNLTLPPFVDGTTERYDSVVGQSGNDVIFVVYENTRAYPSYLITYKI